LGIAQGATYGTILCDLERGCVVDLLSERSAQVLSKWLSSHPEVEVISRDHAGMYAQGASAGAPQAQQVADRFHLLQNLTEVMRRVLDRQHALLKEASKEDLITTPGPVAEAEHEQTLCKPTASQQRRQDLYERIKEMENTGQSIRAISRQLQIHRATVRRFLQAAAAPQICVHNSPISATVLSGYTDTIDGLMNGGETNMTSLFKELKKEGFRGSVGPVYRYIRRHHLDVKPLTARSATWLLLKDEGKMTEREGRLRTRLTERSTQIRTSADLARRFSDIMRNRKPDQFDAWLCDAESSGISEFSNFANGLRRDYNAVRASLTLEWSNGPVEGHTNRLKLVKRCMYGRGSLALLKKRYIRAA
jgi:transposase